MPSVKSWGMSYISHCVSESGYFRGSLAIVAFVTKIGKRYESRHTAAVHATLIWHNGPWCAAVAFFGSGVV